MKYSQEMKSAFSYSLVMEEASRCLLCYDAPCSKSCPAGTDPAKFIRSVRFLNFKGGAETIRINNILGGICARVCPTERYCELGCSRSGIDKPIDIGRIQRFLTDFEKENNMHILDVNKAKNKNIAVIGSGPGGLSIAGLLAKDGYGVTIYEKESKAGGYLRYGIPEYRLPNSVVDDEINIIKNLGVKFVFNTKVGEDISLDDIKEKYSAVILAIGTSKGKILDMFKNNKYVISAVDLLKKIKNNPFSIKILDSALIIGGGDVAMDVSTSLRLLGFKYVSDVVFETNDEFKASKEEKEIAYKEGVSIFDGYIPISIQNNEVTFKHRFTDATLKIKSDLIVLAIGQEADYDGLDVEFNKNEVKEKQYRINNSNLFYVGDIAHLEKTVVYAVRSAKEVAFEVKRYLGGK